MKRLQINVMIILLSLGFILMGTVSLNGARAYYVAPMVGQGSPTCVAPPSGVVSWWPGDGNANDIQGSNNGALVNGATFAPGKVGQAFSLDGVDDYVQLSNSPYNPFPATGFTYDFWINPFDTPSGRSRTIISNHHATGNWWNGISLVNGSVELVLQNAATGQTFRWLTSSTLTSNAGQLIAVAYQNQGNQATDAVIYINGTAQAINTFSSGPAYSTGFTPGYSAADPLGFALGRLLEDTPNAYFRGLIDEGEFFNRALPQAEIQSIVNAGSAGKCKPSCVAPPSGLVSWWPGEGNANDIQDGNNAALLGNPSFTTGRVAQAFQFDGNDDYAKVVSSTTLDVGEGSGLTIDAWISPDDLSSRPLVEWSNSAGLTGVHLWSSVSAPGSLFANLVGDNGTTSHFIVSPPNVLATNNFQHVALTYNKASGQTRLYHNGIIVAESNLGTFTPTTTFDLFFGRRPSALLAGALFSGIIDEVELFSRALDPSEIYDIFNAGSAGKCRTCTPPPSGLLSWWPGDGSANDIQGSNNATVQNGAGFAAGMVEQAFSFDGVDDVVTTPLTVSYASGVTFDAWVKTTDNSGAVLTDGGGSSADRGMGLFIEPGGGISLFGSKATAFTLNFFIPGPVINDGTFHQIAATWTGNTDPDAVKLYVDGVLVGAATALASISTGSTPIQFGGHTGIGFDRFAGLIDEIEIFNRVLSQPEIQSIFNAGSAGKCKTPANTPPEAHCQNVTVSATASCTADASIDNGSSDPDGDSITLTQLPQGPYALGATSVTQTVTDSKGASSTCTATVTVVDTTPPVVTCPANVVVFLPLNSTATAMPVSYAAPTATDNCSTPSVTSSPASGSTFPVGTTTVNATATDAAGNHSSCSFTVTVLYNFSGFFQPVDNPPTVNVATAGSAIPVKFSLSGNKGLTIFAAGYPVSQQVVCIGGAPLNDIEETLTSGNSSLSYDATTDQYKYVWTTDRAWRGTCRKLILKLNDGSEHVANFQFR